MNKVLEIMAESLEVDASEVSGELVFRDHLGWNSLAALSLITAIEDECGVVLGDTDLRGVKTVQELADLVAKRSEHARK